MLLLAAGIAAAAAAGSQDSQQAYYDPQELAQLIERQHEPYVLIDVRRPDEYASGHIPTAVNIPVDSLTEHPPEALKDTKVIVYCLAGSRSARAGRILLDMGFTRVTDFESFRRWEGELILP